MYCLYEDARPVEEIRARCGRCTSVGDTSCAARRIQPGGWGFFSCQVQASRTRQRGIPSLGWGSLIECFTTWFLWDWRRFHQWHRIQPCSWFRFRVSRWYSSSQWGAASGRQQWGPVWIKFHGAVFQRGVAWDAVEGCGPFSSDRMAGDFTGSQSSWTTASEPGYWTLLEIQRSAAFENGVLYYWWEFSTGHCSLMVAPKALRKELICLFHNAQTAGHLGRDKTLEQLRRRFWWYGMSVDVRLHIATCGACCRNKPVGKTPKAPLENYQAGHPGDRIHMDLLGPFCESASGKRYVLMVIDQFTRWLENIPLVTQDAQSVVQAFFEQYVVRFGVPVMIQLGCWDNGTCWCMGNILFWKISTAGVRAAR